MNMDSQNLNDVKMYKNVCIKECIFSERDIIGDESILSYSTLGRRVSIGRNNVIDCCIIGDCSYTGDRTTIKHAEIGKYCSISWNVSIGGANHDMDHLTTCPLCRVFDDEKAYYQSFVSQQLTIGNDVWIGSGATVLRGVRIGDGAIIGANAVVTKDVPPYTVWGGVPAKQIKQRFSNEIIDRLLKLKWWDWSKEEIEANHCYFKKSVTINILDAIEKKYQIGDESCV